MRFFWPSGAALLTLLVALSPAPSLAADTNESADTPLKLAARAGDLALTRRLVRQGAAVNETDKANNTALISAAFHNRAEVVKYLLAAGADPDLQAASGYRALDYAMENRHRAVVAAMLDHWLRKPAAGTPPAARQSLRMTLAAVRGEGAVLQSLLRNKLDPNQPNPSGYTPLAMAAAWGQTQAVSDLLAAGARPGLATRSRYNTTPLMESTRDGRTAIAQLLLDAGADVNQPDVHGDHALNWACYFGHLDMVTLLVQRGSRLDVKGQTPDTALAIAIREKHTAVEQFLRAAGAPLN